MDNKINDMFKEMNISETVLNFCEPIEEELYDRFSHRGIQKVFRRKP